MFLYARASSKWHCTKSFRPICNSMKSRKFWFLKFRNNKKILLILSSKPHKNCSQRNSILTSFTKTLLKTTTTLIAVTIFFLSFFFHLCSSFKVLIILSNFTLTSCILWKLLIKSSFTLIYDIRILLFVRFLWRFSFIFLSVRKIYQRKIYSTSSFYYYDIFQHQRRRLYCDNSLLTHLMKNPCLSRTELYEFVEWERKGTNVIIWILWQPFFKLWHTYAHWNWVL